jgi:ribonuclease E
MLIDAAHPEQTRVVLVSGNRVEEFDFETATKKQLKGNIYLAKVTRVEPSLQAAFVEYGGNRHGFLAFGEIHPDYYQIPVEDRLALLEEEAAEDDEEDDDDRSADAASQGSQTAERSEDSLPSEAGGDEGDPSPGNHETDQEEGAGERSGQALEDSGRAPIEISTPSADGENFGAEAPRQEGEDAEIGERAAAEIIEVAEPKDSEAAPEAMGAEDALEELPRRRRRPMRRYKIQEVIKRRQILLIQVVKEERGTKGAALTTFLSLAGRYCVLMPNTDRGGGISRKITSGLDRKRLKDIAIDLEVPEGMGLIIRTAGANRTRPELKRDFEYLLRLWESVRELTLKSSAPALVYEEGNLVKRSIRDLYGRDIEAVLVEGDEAYKDAKAFMKMLTPSHAKHVQQYKDKMPLFQRYQVETQLDLLYSPRVDLRSGGYIVLNSTEALVAIDVNSGKSTREHSIEETALRTNLEASEEVARQLRLRDLAGLIVIDYIDMEEHRHNRAVERRLKDHLKTDRARIQVGRISAFGLLEMSRQRLRASVLEGSTLVCPHCTGAGRVSSVETQTLRILRAIEEEGIRGRMEGAHVKAPADVALYLLNHKREMLRQIEERFGLPCYIEAGVDLKPGQFSIEKEEAGLIDWRPAQAVAISPDSAFIEVEPEAEPDDQAEPDTHGEETVDAEPIEIEAPRAESAERMREDAEQGSRRRRRGRRGGRGREDRERPRGPDRDPVQAKPREASVVAPEIGDAQAELSAERPAARDEDQIRRRRRGRRGGRRNRRDRPEADQPIVAGEAGNGAQPSHASGPDQDTPFIHDEPRGEPETPTRGLEVREAQSDVERFPAPARETHTHGSNGHDGEPHASPRETPPAQSEPAPAPQGSDEPNQPRRKGWWQRRIFGE